MASGVSEVTDIPWTTTTVPFTDNDHTTEAHGGTVQFGVVDYCVFSLMLVCSVGVGVYSAIRSRGSKATVREYLTAGNSLPALPVALSLLGGVISALSILGNATEMYMYGTQLATNLVGAIFGVFFIQNLILPIFFKLKLVSYIEYLELRFHSTFLRKLASCSQLMSMFFFLGVCLYAPALALSSATRLPSWAAIVTLGVICTIYVSIGGVRAVVYTDVIQTLLMFGGVLTVVVKVVVDMGGLGTVWELAEEGGRIEFFNMDTSPFTRHTFWSTSVLGFYFILGTVGLSQAQYQRFVSVKNIQQCTWLLKFFLVGLFVLWGMFYLSGLVAYAAYHDCDPYSSGKIEKPDQIVPYLVMDKLGVFPGLPGLFVAAVYGGVLSSMSSQANSVACLLWEDFLKGTKFFSSLSNSAATNVVKLLSMFAGFAGIGLAMAIGRLGTLFNVAYSVAGAISGPLDGVFLAGIFIPWANHKGAIAGLVTSFAFNVWLLIGKLVRGSITSPYLPLSTDGCPETLLNTTTTTTTTPLEEFTTILPFSPDDTPATPGHSIYDISYCYSGVMGIINCVLVCSIVSLFTHPYTPAAVNPLLVNPTCLRLYRRLWRLLASVGWTKGGLEEVEGWPGKLEGPNRLKSVSIQTTLVLNDDDLEQTQL